jgi:anti-anti-sigma factor
MDTSGERSEVHTARPQQFRVIREEADDRIVVHVLGDLDMATAAELRAALHPDSGRPMIVDLAETTFMDSSGLNALVAAWHLGIIVAVRHPSPIIRQAIEISGLDRVLTIEA